MLGVLAAYVIGTLVSPLCKNTIFNYITKRLVGGIFTNTFSLYFMTHIPVGLTTLVGFKFGNHIPKV